MWGSPSSHRECEAPSPQHSAVGEAGGFLGRARVTVLELSTFHADVPLTNAVSSCLHVFSGRMSSVTCASCKCLLGLSHLFRRKWTLDEQILILKKSAFP